MYKIKGIDQLLTEDQVLKAASASGMDISSYLIGVGGYFVEEDIDVDKDVYSVPGLNQEVTFKQLQKGAQASNLNFDEYIAGIGAIKKKEPIKEEDMVLSGAMPSLDIPKIEEVEEEKEEPGVLESLAAQTARGFVGTAKSMLDFRNMGIFSIMEAANPQDFKTPQDRLNYYRAIQMIPSFVGGTPTASAYQIGKVEEDISEHVKQFDSSATENLLKGNIGAATQQIVGGALESIPSLIMAAAGTPGLIMLATSSTGSKFDQELQQNPDKATGRLVANAIASGVTEAAFERVTYGLLKGAKVLTSQGREEAARELFEAGAKEIIKNFGVGIAKEGASEAATTMSVKLIDAATLNKDLLTYDNLFEITDAGLIGGFVGGSIKSVEMMSNYSEAGRDRAATILASESDALVQQRNLERFNKRIKDISNYRKNPDKKITDTELLEQAKQETESFERSVKQNKITNRRKLSLISESGDLQAYASNKQQIRKSKAVLSTLDKESTLFEDTKNKLADLVAKEQAILDNSLQKVDKENLDSEIEFTKQLADKGVFGETELEVVEGVETPDSYAETELGDDKFSISVNTKAIKQGIEQNNGLQGENIFTKSDKKETSESISDTYEVITGPTTTLGGTSVKHEFLHGILRKYFGKAIESKPSEVKKLFDNTLSLVESLEAKGKISNSKFLVKRLKQYQRNYINNINATKNKINKGLTAGTLTQKQADEFNAKAQEKLNKKMLDASEEIITAISDGLTTGDLVENKSNSDKIKDFFRQTYKDIGLKKELKLDTPEQIFNFVKDYNREFKRKKLSKATKAVAAGKVFANSEVVSNKQPLLSGLVETITKFSLKEGLSEKVQNIYENQGMNGAMEILELYRPMVLKLSNKFKDVPGFIKNKDLFVEEALLGNTGVLTMMMTYKPGTKVKGTDIDVSLAGYINKYLPLRVNAIAGKVFDRTFNQDITEEQVVNSVDSTVYDGQDFSESFDQVEEKELKSKLRRKLGLTDEVLNSVRQGVINAFTSENLPSIKAKVKGQPFKFKRELEKMFEKELRAVIQTQMGSDKQYEAFIKKNMQNILDFIPLSAKTKSKWDIYYEPVIDPKTGKQVVYSNKQIKRLGLSELFAGTSPKAFKQKIPTEQEVLDYFINPPSVTAEGKRVMFKGNRKEALARELSRILALDATMEVIQNPNQQVFTKAETKKTASGSILIPSKPTGKTVNILEILEEQNKSEIQAGAIIAEISAAINRDPNLKFSLNINKDKLSELLNKDLKEKYLIKLNNFASNLAEELTNRIEKSKVENNLDEEYIREVLVNANWDTDNIKPADKKKLDDMVKLIESYKAEQAIIANNEINKILAEAFNKDLESQIENDPSEVLSSDQIDVDLDKADGHTNVSSINKIIRKGKNLSRIFTKKGYFTLKGKGGVNGVKVLSKMFFDVNEDGKVVNPTAEQVFRMMIFLNSYYGGRGRLHKNKGDLNEAIIEPLLKNNKEAFGNLIKVYTTTGGATKIQVLTSNEGKPKYSDITLRQYSNYIGKSLGKKVVSGKLTYEELSNKNIKKDFDTKTELAREIFFDVIERVKKLRDDGIINDLEAKAIVYNALETSASTTSGVSIGTYINSVNYVIAVEGTKDFYLEHLDPSETLRKRVLIYLFNSEGEAGYKDFEEFKSDVESMESAYVDIRLKEKIDSVNSLKTGYDGKGTDGLKNRFFSKEKFKNNEGNKVIIPHDLVLETLTGNANGDYLELVKDLKDKGDDVKDLKNDKPIDTKTPKSEPTDSKPILEQKMSTIIGQKTGVTQDVDEALAKQISKRKRKGIFSFFIPPSAEDFEGLLYKLLPKGKKGEKAMEFFNKNLFKPYARAMYDFEVAKNQNLQNFKELKKIFKQSGINLKGRHESGWTNEQLIRVFLHSRLHPDTPIPGVAENSTVYNIAEEFVSENTSNIQKIGKVRSIMDLFNSKLNLITAKSGNVVYPPLGRDWTAGSMFIDIVNFTNTTKREDTLSEWQENVDTIFSKSNIDKMTLAFGENYTNALTNMLQRMKTGRAAPGPSFKGSRTFNNWVTDASATIMFFNTKSAILQTLSTINFVNWSDNNPIAAGKAFANIKQYSKDVAFIMNSDFLKSRRSGIKIDVNADILAREAENSTNKIRAMANGLLKMGFIPTQIGDSFAISIGGATFYRNRTNKYIKDGLSKSEAESKAFLDFKEITESTQQSSRQDRISQQQVSPLGRFVLAFANTPMQYARLTKKAYLDLVNNRGDWKTNASKVLYYGAIQNTIFSYLQQAMFAVFFDEEEEEERTEQRLNYAINNGVDGLLRGLGYGGAIASTAKNMVMEAVYQAKKDRPDFEQVAIQSTSISPPINKKLKSLLSASRVFTYKKTREKVFEEGLSFDNPGLYAASQVISTTVNVPADRVIRKLDNIRTSKVLERVPYISNLVEKVGFVSDQETEFWQEFFLVLGWSRWDVNAIDIDDKKRSDKEEDAIKKALQERIYSPIVPIKK